MAEKLHESPAKAHKEDLSIKDFVLILRSVGRYLRRKWIVILFAGLVGAAFGFILAKLSKPKYTAGSSFVLEDPGKGGGLSQYAGIASLAGIDLGGGAGGIFQGDNIIQLYRSRTMLEQTLLTPADFDGKQQMLIDRYIEFNKLRDQWAKNPALRNISFAGDPAKFNRAQDSIITDIVVRFNKSMLSVDKFDKKLGIINVNVTAEDELFAKEFNTKLVQNVNSFYTKTKTKKSNLNVAILQRQADSVKRILGSSISGVASAIDAAPNANPALTSLRVPSQKRQVDVQANGAIYAEIVKNLELSKINLRQETPLIQMIDEPVLPLDVKKLGAKKGMVIGFLICSMLTIVGLVISRSFKKIMS